MTRLTGSQEADAHGNVQLSGSGALGDMLSDLVKNKLKIKRVRADTLGYAQRSYLGVVSDVDAHEAGRSGRRPPSSRSGMTWTAPSPSRGPATIPWTTASSPWKRSRPRPRPCRRTFSPRKATTRRGSSTTTARPLARIWIPERAPNPRPPGGQDSQEQREVASPLTPRPGAGTLRLMDNDRLREHVETIREVFSYLQAVPRHDVRREDRLHRAERRAVLIARQGSLHSPRGGNPHCRGAQRQGEDR